jgi:hypothetical protein
MKICLHRGGLPIFWFESNPYRKKQWGEVYLPSSERFQTISGTFSKKAIVLPFLMKLKKL